MKRKTRFIMFGVGMLIVMLMTYLLFALYYDVKDRTINDFNTHNMLLAEQTANGIKKSFESYRIELLNLSILRSINYLNNWGKAILENYYSLNSSKLLAVSRIDSEGNIVYTYPPNPEILGENILDQAHVQQVFETQKPIISDIFTAVQGYRCIAYHIPVMDGDKFNGSLAVLVPFQYLAETYLKNTQTGPEGTAWLVSQNGTGLYCQLTGQTDIDINKIYADNPSVLDLVSKMTNGDKGISIYIDKNGEKQHAVYCPVPLGNKYWSVMVSSPEKEVLATLRSFQRKMILIAGIILLFGLVYSYYIIDAVKIINEEKKRKKIETALRESEKKYKDLADLLPQIVFETDIQGNLTYTNNQAFILFGYTESDFNKGVNIFQMVVPQDLERAKENMVNILQGAGNDIDHEYLAKHKDGSTFPVLIYSAPYHHNNEPQGLRGVILDTTEIKKAEQQIQKSLQEKEILLKEIHHRVKNNLHVISSLLSLQAAKITTTEQAISAFRESRNRVFSIAQVHEQLYKSDDFSKIDMSTYITSITDELKQIYAPDKDIKIESDINNIHLDVTNAVPCGLILNELISNAFKHAFPENDNGVIHIHFHSLNKQEYEIKVCDNGIGIPEGINIQSNGSLGMQLISVLTKQIDGNLIIKKDNGTTFIIKFPKSVKMTA